MSGIFNDSNRLKGWLEEANLAPSLHNIQPGRFKVLSDTRIALFHDRSLRLPVADASDQDVLVSLGCLVEGLRLAMSVYGYALVRSNDAKAEASPEGFQWIATYEATTGASKDALQPFVRQRKSHRGVFAQQKDLNALQSEFAKDDHVTLLLQKDQIKSVADLHAKASLGFFRDASYMKELFSWMRFSKTDPRYAQDGLNAENMSLSGVESAAAGLLLKPKVFPWADKIGMGGTLAGEKPQSLSATGLLIFSDGLQEDKLQVGANFYRAWLRLTKCGYAACPMSSSLDDAQTRAEIEKIVPNRSGNKHYNILRFGPAPKEQPARARRDVSTLLMESL